MGHEKTVAQYLREKLHEIRNEVAEYTRQADERAKMEQAQNALLKHGIQDLKAQIEVWKKERLEAMSAYYIIQELIQAVEDASMTIEAFYKAVAKLMQEVPK